MISHASKDENGTYKLYIHTVPKEISCYDWNKYYVGITKNNVNHRWENGCGYKSQPFYRAIKKYGWNNMKHEILFDNLTKKEATRLEQIIIMTLRSNNRKFGYNITEGGDGTLGHKMTEEEKYRKKILYTGEGNPFYNCKHTSETRKLMSLHHYDCSGDNNPHNKHVFMFDLNGYFLKEYVSITDACKDNNITDTCIIRAIQERRQGNNYFWGYKDDIIIDDNNIKMKYNYRRIHKRDKQVEQYTLDNQYVQTYKNITIAAEQVNGSRQGIIASIRRNGTAYGYKWKYKENNI